MRKRKSLILLIIIIATILMSIVPLTKVYAETTQTPLILGIVELRTGSTPNMGYAIGDPNANQQEDNASASKLWNIVKYASTTAQNFEEINAYCVKAGVGF